MVLHAAFLREDRAEGDALIERTVVRVGVAAADEFVKSREIQTQVEVVDKCVFLVSDIDKGGVQGGQEFLDSTEVDVTHREIVSLARLLVEFNQPAVFHQGDVNFLRRYVDDQVFVGFLRFHLLDTNLRKKGCPDPPSSPSLSAES